MDFSTLLSWIVDWGTMGYFILFMMTFGESFVLTGLFVPGTVVLVLMGGLASTRDSFDLPLLAIAAISGAILGNAVSYEFGRFGRVQLDRWSRFNSPLSRAQFFFQRHHGKSVFLGRFIGPIRPFIPFVAGAFGMNRMPFHLYNILSAFLWCAWFLAMGYAFGFAWKQAFFWSTAGIAIFVSVIVLVIAIVWYRRRRHRASADIHIDASND